MVMLLAASGSDLRAQRRIDTFEPSSLPARVVMLQHAPRDAIAQADAPALPPGIGGFLGTGLGSLVGTAAGVLFGGDVFYDATGCCGGGDDPGLTSALAFGVAGTVVGGGIGGYLGTRAQRVPFLRMLAGSAGGTGAGFAVAGLLSGFDGPAAGIGYFGTQAAFNGLNAAHWAAHHRD